MASNEPLKRKERPCDACRKRKSRCVLESDDTKCVLCKFHGQECTFVQNPQVRKRKAPQEGGDPDAAKRRFIILQSHHHVPWTDKPQRQSSLSGPAKKSAGIKARVIRTNTGTGVEEYDDLEGPSLLKKTLGLQNKHHSQYVGATRGLEPVLLGDLALKENCEVQLASGTLRLISSTDAFLLLPDPGTQNYEDELDDLDTIEEIVKPHGRLLVDLYFRIVFPSFPIVHKQVYLEKYNRSYREFSPPLLAAVYLLALQYWSYDDALNKFKKPDVVELEKLARKAFADTIHRPKLSTVQAGLLLLQHTDTDSAELTAQLVSVAYGLGLHLDASNWNIPDWEKGLRKRLGWALYMQDKWSSLGSGRPALINASNWGLRPVTNDDFPEKIEDDQEGSSEVDRGRILFSQMISLSEILAELLETVFSVKASRDISNARDNGITIVLNKVKPVQLKLKEWFINLPESLSMDDIHVMKLNSVGYLRLAYIATEITLHRRILLSLSPSTDPQLYRICRSVARERFMFAMNFIQSLKPQHLSSFWYFASPQNFALVGIFGTLLLSTASDTQDGEFYQAKLKEYRWTLKINSENGAKYMKPAMTLLDANMGLLTEAENLSRLRAESITLLATTRTDSIGSANSDRFSYSNAPSANGGESNTAAQYPFDTAYFAGHDSMITPPITYSIAHQNIQSQDFDFELGNNPGLWSY